MFEFNGSAGHSAGGLFLFPMRFQSGRSGKDPPVRRITNPGESFRSHHHQKIAIKFFVQRLHLATTIIPRPPVDSRLTAVPSLPTGSPPALPSALRGAARFAPIR